MAECSPSHNWRQNENRSTFRDSYAPFRVLDFFDEELRAARAITVFPLQARGTPKLKYEEALAVIEPNIDEHGLIVHNKEQWGGGDTAQRVGMWFYGMALAFPEQELRTAINFTRMRSKLERSPGNYSRHTEVPGAPGWYTDVNDFSRDQSIPLLVAMGKLMLRDSLSEFAQATWNRGMRAQNGDPWWWPYYLAMWLRAEADAWGPKWYNYLNPILWLGDFSLVLASIWGCIWGKFNPGHSDDVNFVLTLLQSHTLDTPLAKIARWIYANYRTGMPKTYETWGPASVLEAYFSPEYTNSGAPRIDWLYNRSGILKNLIQ